MKVPLLDLKAQYKTLKKDLDAAILRDAGSGGKRQTTKRKRQLNDKWQEGTTRIRGSL